MHWLIALVVMSLGLFSFAQPKSSKSPLPHFIEELKISCPGPTDPFKMRQELYTALMQTRAMWPPDSAPPEALGKLVYVMYLEGNNKGWILWDSDGDGKFDKKRSIVWQSQ